MTYLLFGLPFAVGASFFAYSALFRLFSGRINFYELGLMLIFACPAFYCVYMGSQSIS